MSAKVYVKDRKFVTSGESSYKILARNGMYLYKENPVFRACVKLGAVSWENSDFGNRLLDQEESFELKIPKIPSKIVEQWLVFGRMIKLRYDSETLILLYYSPSTGEFKNEVPEQEVSPGSVRSTECTPAPEGSYLVGSIHTHPGEAFHSKTDQDDESVSDGVHFTIGDLRKVLASFSIFGVVNGRRFPLDPEGVIETAEIPEEWNKRIHRV